MKTIKIVSRLIILCVIFSGNKAFCQTKSGIAIGYMLNKPLSKDYKAGGGISLTGNIAIAKKWIIAPEISYDYLNGNNKHFYNINGYVTKTIQNIDLFHIGVCARYQFNPTMFVKAGPIFYAGGGNDDIAAAGIGGTSAAGYNLNLDKHNMLEFSINLTVVSIDDAVSNGVTPYAGLKLTYAFNFGKAVRSSY